tara:strand:+ start:569 stop:673 length:105 start_codon:yes stop_codon:yes gene_type:complete
MHLEEKVKTAEDRIKELQLLINEWKKAINDKRSQ